MTDAVDKIGGVSGLVPPTAARLRLGRLLLYLRPAAGHYRDATTYLTQLTRSRGVAAARLDAAPLS